jgi:hypothetical protein
MELLVSWLELLWCQIAIIDLLSKKFLSIVTALVIVNRSLKEISVDAIVKTNMTFSGYLAFFEWVNELGYSAPSSNFLVVFNGYNFNAVIAYYLLNREI